MRILVVVSSKKLLIWLHTEELIDEVKDLIERNKHSKAIDAVLTKGRLEREIAHHEIPDSNASLILSENGVHWDIG